MKRALCLVLISWSLQACLFRPVGLRREERREAHRDRDEHEEHEEHREHEERRR
jgi:hypothetical protein